MSSDRWRWALMKPRAITVDGIGSSIEPPARAGAAARARHGRERSDVEASCRRWPGGSRSGPGSPRGQSDKPNGEYSLGAHAARCATRWTRSGKRALSSASRSGRRGHAVCVSIPGALRAFSPGGQRWAGPGGLFYLRLLTVPGFSTSFRSCARRGCDAGNLVSPGSVARGFGHAAIRRSGATHRWRTRMNAKRFSQSQRRD
jgi:hypothetical protein